MNILVTGAEGQLGNEMRIAVRNGKDRYLFADIVGDCLRLDITDANAVRAAVRDNDIKCIVNCAAYTNVDKAEDEPELCELLNAKAVENLACAMKEAGGLLVHVSTDYVFGGDPYNVPCTESQKGTPTGVYGLTKLHGEQAIIQSGCEYLIFRTSWLYSEFGKNFVKTMLALTSTKPFVNVVFDQCGTPTYAYDLAKAIFHVVDNRLYAGNSGIYHYSNEGVCSWYDFTKMIAQYAGNSSCDIRPCHSDEFPSKVRRPSYSVLDKTKIKSVFGISIPYWTDSLGTCINNISNGGTSTARQ